MGYLAPAEYAAYGLTTETADAWITTASTMIEGFCRRPTLNAASYTERMRVPLRAQTIRLSYGPLISVDGVQAQYACPPNRYAMGDECGLQTVFAAAFSLPGQWVTVDPTTLDVSLPTGEVCFATNVFGLNNSLGLLYGVAEVTYTAGLATIPDAVKVACAQIVKNAQATPGLNVKSSKMDTLQTQYFSGSLLDAQVQSLLRPYVAERLG